MSYVIKIVGDQNGKQLNVSGQFVRVYEPTAFGGRGMLELTVDPTQAHQEETEEEAIGYSMLEDQGGKTPLLARYTLEVIDLTAIA